MNKYLKVVLMFWWLLLTCIIGFSGIMALCMSFFFDVGLKNWHVNLFLFLYGSSAMSAAVFSAHKFADQVYD